MGDPGNKEFTMISRRPATKQALLIGLGLLLFVPATAGLLFSSELPRPVVVTSVGIGAPPAETEPLDSAPAPSGALEDAGRKAVLSYLYSVLGSREFLRLKDALDTLVLPHYRDYITKTEILSVSELPGGDAVVLSAAVTIDAAALAGYLENIEKLDAKPQAPRTLSAAEKEILISKAQAIYIQGEVASDILLDRIRGIESFLSAKALFETAESSEGVYRCLMGIGRARASLGDVTTARTDLDGALNLAAGLGRADYAAARIARARLLAGAGDLEGARREIADVLNDPSFSGYDGIVGEALLIDAELDYRAGDYESAGTKLTRAVGTFEAAGDVKRLTQAQLLTGLVLIAERDGPGAVGSFKLARSLADKFDDRISDTKALIGMSRASRIAGDPKTAALYLDDALKTARDAGWGVGELACLCEEAYTQSELGNAAGAEAAAAAAHAAALSRQDPALIAAALLAVGEVARAAGNDRAALDALVSCIETSSDVRVVGRDVPFLFFGDAQRDAALSHLLLLSAGAGKEKTAFAAVAGYEAAIIAREALLDSPALPDGEAGLMRSFRDAAMRAIAAEDVSIGGESVTFSDTSRAEAARLLDEALRTLDDARKRIARESPRLAVLIGIKETNPADFARGLPAGAALVHYVIHPEGAYALVVTGKGASIVDLPAGYEDISAALIRHGEAAASLTIGADGEVPLDFTQASTSLASMLLAPAIPTLAGITTIGIAPGLTREPLPMSALGRYNEEGRFSFLGEDYILFDTSWLSPSAADFSPAPDTSAGGVLVVGEMELPGADEAVPAAEPSAPEGAGGGNNPAPDGNASLPIVRYSPDSRWWDAPGGLVVFQRKDVWGRTDFSRVEYLSCLSSLPVIVVPDTAAPDAVSAFLKEMVAASGGRPVLFGYADALRIAAATSRSGGSTGWIRFILISDFVSVRK
jgi:tetratricopeptide (TPR) repeat protein